jgi:hypothetical protein
MSSSCKHAETEVVTDEITGDFVVQCCDCKKTFGRDAPQQMLPKHWYDNIPSPYPHLVTAADVLSGQLPREPSDVQRYVHICGNCRHWLSAAHSHYFNNVTPPYDKAQDKNCRPWGFAGDLMESLCPKCGAANFRWGSVVMAYYDAKLNKKHRDGPSLTRYIHNRADIAFWSATEDSIMLEMGLKDIGNYAPRCPCCGYAVSYGDREFDFHHWDYENDLGCHLCRECHSHIHRGLTVSEQEEKTGNWKRDAINRLYTKSVDNGLTFTNKSGFIRRFNIKSNPELVPDKP